MRHLLASALAACFLVSPITRAQTAPSPSDPSSVAAAAPDPITNALRDPSALMGGAKGLSSALGLGSLDGDFYLQSTTMLDLDLGPVGVGLMVPLNLLVWSNNEPPTRADKTWFNVLRKSDYPMPSADNYGQYLKMVRYARLGHKRDPLYIYFGQMFSASVGHGTMVNRYNNTLNQSRTRNGLQFDVNWEGFGGFETIMDDVSWPGTSLAGARVYVQPLGSLGLPLFSRFAIGGTAMVDRSAPTAVGSGAPVDGLPVVTGQREQILYGFDAELPVLTNDVISLVPYVDYNIQSAGHGLHVGANATFRFPIFSALTVWTRLEARLMQTGYIPDYFDASYDMQRYQYPVTVDGALVPKAVAGDERVKAAGGVNAWRPGYYGEASARLFGFVTAGAMYMHALDVPKSGNLTVFMNLPVFPNFKLNAYYLRKNFDQLEELWQLDNRSVLSATAMYQVFGPFWAMANYQRSWRADPKEGALQAVDNWSLGMQVQMPL